MVFLLSALAILASLPAIYSISFETHCTLPQQDVSYVSGPNVRSTLEIFWSSMATIFLCTWTVLHLNIPKQATNCEKQTSPAPSSDTDPQSLDSSDTDVEMQASISTTPSTQDQSLNSPIPRYFRDFVRWLSRKPKWMIITLIVPEFLIGISMSDFIAAWRSSRCHVMRIRAQDSGFEWTMTHAYYANMGGFILRYRSGLCDDCRISTMTHHPDPSTEVECHHSPGYTTPLSTLPVVQTPELGIYHSYSDCHDNVRDPTSAYTYGAEPSWEGELPVAIRAMDLCALLSNGAVERLPPITKQQINGQSKEEPIAKLLTILQVLWLFAQLLVRKIQGLPSTQLEIATLSYALCTFITYMFWLQKPKDLVSTTDVIAARRLTDEDIAKLNYIEGDGSFGWINGSDSEKRSTYFTNGSFIYESGFGTLDLGEMGDIDITSEEIGFIIGGVIFGSAHLIAWNFQFPTAIEQLLWRIASLITIGGIPVWYIVMTPLGLIDLLINKMQEAERKKMEEIKWSLKRGFTIMGYLIYGLCRVFMMAECFRGLFYSPPEVFKATWTEVLPRFS